MTKKSKIKKMDLSDFFITKSQANDFAVGLSTIIDTMYTANFQLEKSLSSQLGVQKKDLFLKLLRENNINSASQTAIQDFLKKVQDTMSNLANVTMTLAFEPSDDILKAFSQWFVVTIGKQVLLDIEVDPRIIAGVKITYNGKFKDYSLGPLFDGLIQKMLHPDTQPISPKPQQTTVPSPHQSTQYMEIGR